MAKLHIENLHVSVAGKEILKGVDLDVTEGKTMALLGPNGHGKSTLLFALMGHPNYTVTEGKVLLDGVDLLSLSVDERSKLGLFLAMQYPAEIPGVNSADFLKAAMNSHREKPMSLFQFYSKMQTAYKEMGIPFEMSTRNLNEGFSGGEKKRNEILQLKLLEPRFALLDEIDSGLDVDAIQVVSSAIREEQKKGRGFLVVSHYARLYDLISPDEVAVMINGRIAVTGGPELIQKIDTQGYEWIKTELGIPVEKEEAKVSIGVCAAKETLVK
ncbi:MAG: Fe-S cluster assembly ATPase SufC [Erysipelotrichaceae bacterium]|nr:Fe-S cluster assembly ATPase SufC [Erysipelotrichaceae bacterium]